MRIGTIGVDAVLDGTGTAPAVRIYADATPAGTPGPQRGGRAEDWARYPRELTADGLLEMTAGGFLIRTGDRVALVDLGFRRFVDVDPPRMFAWTGGAFLANLAAAGVRPGDVTDVFFTHLHYDHLGWATDDAGAPIFANAEYRCHRADWAYFMPAGAAPRDAGIAARIGPLADRMGFWEGDETVLPGVDAIAAPGHTPGSTVFAVSSGADRLLLIGDIAHCAVELIDPQWGQLGEVDRDQARRTLAGVAAELSDGHTLGAAGHFPGLAAGRLTGPAGDRRWTTVA
jgi:glyoxylase-like metal-dependent hydrolase (beta-lactamase superfamily II)